MPIIEIPDLKGVNHKRSIMNLTIEGKVNGRAVKISAVAGNKDSRLKVIEEPAIELPFLLGVPREEFRKFAINFDQEIKRAIDAQIKDKSWQSDGLAIGALQPLFAYFKRKPEATGPLEPPRPPRITPY